MAFWSRYSMTDVMCAVHHVHQEINQVKELIVGAVQDAVDAVSSQLDRAKLEIVNKISELETAIANGETPDLTALKAAAQALDDVVADAVEPPSS